MKTFTIEEVAKEIYDNEIVGSSSYYDDSRQIQMFRKIQKPELKSKVPTIDEIEIYKKQLGNYNEDYAEFVNSNIQKIKNEMLNISKERHATHINEEIERWKEIVDYNVSLYSNLSSEKLMNIIHSYSYNVENAKLALNEITDKYDDIMSYLK